MTVDEPVADIQARLAGLTAEEILADAAARYPGRPPQQSIIRGDPMTQPETVPTIVPSSPTPPPRTCSPAVAASPPVALATSLGVEDQALTHMIAEAELDIPIFTLDTGRLYPETYDLIDRTCKRYGLKIAVYFPDAREVEEMVARDGVNLFRDSEFQRHLCCETRKVKPLRRAQSELDAWVCGLRSGQGATREKVEAVEWDGNADSSSSTRWPSGTRRACGTTSARTTSPTTRCTTRASPASAARRARARWRRARTGAPVAGGGRAPSTASAACITGRSAGPTVTGTAPMNQLDTLEAKSVHILREAYRSLGNVCMLWSIGKDSTVLLHLARKAFFGHVPIPLVHIDTAYKMPEMIEYRDRLALEWHLNLVVGQNRKALEEKATFPDGNCDRIQCCRNLKTMALKHTLDGEWPRLRMDHTLGRLVEDEDHSPYTGVIVGVRADEEGSRSKERYFSPRDVENDWNVDDQPPELWRYFKTDFEPGTHVRVHPLLDWTELNVWEYIERESIPVTSLYFDDGTGTRCRSLGCWPCTTPVQSEAKNVADIIEELRTGKFSNIAERSGRAQDKDDGGGLESLRRGGYM